MDDKKRRTPGKKDLLESLKKSHAVLKGVVESPKGVVIFALDRQYRYIAFNRNHHQTMKQIWGVDIALGNSMLDYIGSTDDRLKAKDNFDRALSGESFTLMEKYGDTALERRYYEDIYNPIINENGDIIGLTLFLTDITERKQIETQLQRRIGFEQTISRISSELARCSGEGIDAVIDNAIAEVGAFTGADRAYIFRFRNDLTRVDNTHEWCAEGIEPQIDGLKNITLDDDLPWFSARIRNRETFHVPNVTSLPPGARLEQELFEAQGIQSLIVVPIETANRLNGFLGFDAVRNRRTWGEDEQNILRFLSETIGNVMARKQAEKALRESEARWQFALEGAGDGVWDWNAVTNRVYFSLRWKTMLGYEQEDIEDTLDEWRSRVHPDDKEATYAEIERHFNGETPVYVSEHRLRCKDGSYKWILDRGKVIQRTEDGKPLRVIGTHTDISEAKLLQAKHEKLIGELREAMAQVKQLSGLLPICSYCKKIRDDKGYWKQIETYIRDHSEAQFSHSICRECAEKHHPEFLKPDG